MPGGGGGGGLPIPPAAVPGAAISDMAAIPPGPPALFPGVPGTSAAVINPGLSSLIPSAPIANAAAVLPTPPIEMLPSLAQGVATILSPPQITIPGIPGFGIPLPKTITAPHELVCIGTGWSAEGPAGSATPVAPSAGSAVPPGTRWLGN
jgi:hypothetical protein